MDVDGDGFGDLGAALDTCSLDVPAGYVTDATDCDDNNAAMNPGVAEICNGLDDNCDGQIDEDLFLTTYYMDVDGDGFGDLGAALDTCLTDAPVGFVTNADDCDDANPDLNPGVAEVCNGVDDNCDGQIDEGLVFTTYYLDNDQDGFGSAEDTAETCDGIAPPGYVHGDGDCDDDNAAINPDAEEIMDGLDNDCNGLVDDVSAVGEFAQSAHRLFPNPTTGELYIEYAFSGKMTVEVFRMDGLLAQMAVLDFGGSQAVLDLGNVLDGVYFLVFTDSFGQRHFVERVVRL